MVAAEVLDLDIQTGIMTETILQHRVQVRILILSRYLIQEGMHRTKTDSHTLSYIVFAGRPKMCEDNGKQQYKVDGSHELRFRQYY